MFANVPQIIRQFKPTWTYELDDESIRTACREVGHQWRERELGPVMTVKMFLLQILFGNVACNFVPRLAGKDVTGSAYCEAPPGFLCWRCSAFDALHQSDGGCGSGHWTVAGASSVLCGRFGVLDA